MNFYKWFTVGPCYLFNLKSNVYLQKTPLPFYVKQAQVLAPQRHQHQMYAGVRVHVRDIER